MDQNATANELIETVMTNGYVVIRDVFDSSYIGTVRSELEQCFEADLKARAEENSGYSRKDEFGYTSVTHGSHMVLGLFRRSPRFARMMNDILANDRIFKLLRSIAGGGFTLRGDNVRRATGKVELGHPLNLPHEWHRDNPGEFGISILMTDILDRDAGATAFVPGTHLLPFDPRRNVLMGQPAFLALPDVGGPISFCNRGLARRAVFGRALARRFVAKSEQALGKAGSICIFLNDTWHGRSANAQGKRNMVAFCGAISARYPFPGNLPAPQPGDAVLPEPLLGMLTSKQEPDPKETCILQWAEAQQKRPKPWDLLWLAQKEHRLISKASVALARRVPKYAAYEWQAGPLES